MLNLCWVFRRFAVVLCLAASMLPLAAQALVIEAAVLALTGRAILDAAERKVNQKMNEVQNYGNGLVSQSIAGINVAMQGARINAGALLDKPLRELKESERTVFLGIRDATAGLDEMTDKAYRLEEVANVDASLLLGSIPTIKDATFISSIRGLSVVKGSAEHRVTVLGTGLGPGRDGMAAKIEVLRDGVALKPLRVESSEHNTAVLVFAPDIFDSSFKSDRVVTLPLDVKLSITRRRFLRDKTTEVVSRTPFTLYPPLLGRATVTADVPVFDWVATGVGEKSWTMRDCGNAACGEGGVVETNYAAPGAEGDLPVPGYRRIVNAECSCGRPWHAPEACGWSYPVQCAVIEGATQVRVMWRVTGVWGTRYAHWKIETYQRVGTKPLVQQFDLSYGQSLSFCVPENVDYYKVEVKTLTKETLVLTPQASLKGRLEYVGAFTCAAKDKRYEYKVGAPS